MKKANRPSEAHRKFVRNRAGELVENMAYNGSAAPATSSRRDILRPATNEPPKRSVREMSAIAKVSSDPEVLDELFDEAGDKRNLASAIAGNAATSSDTLREIYQRYDGDPAIREKIIDHPNVPWNDLNDKDFTRAVNESRRRYPAPTVESLEGMSRARAEQYMKTGRMVNGLHSRGAFRELTLESGRIYNSFEPTKSELAAMSDEAFSVYARDKSSSNTASEDFVNEAFDRGYETEALRAALNSKNLSSMSPAVHEKLAHSPNLKGYQATGLYNHVSDQTRRTLVERHGYGGDGLIRGRVAVADATRSTDKTAHELVGGVKPDFAYSSGRALRTYTVKPDVSAFKGLSDADMADALGVVYPHNGARRYDSETGIFTYEIDSSD